MTLLNNDVLIRVTEVIQIDRLVRVTHVFAPNTNRSRSDSWVRMLHLERPANPYRKERDMSASKRTVFLVDCNH